MSQTPLLETKGLSKRYGKVTVLSNVSLEFRSGEIHALLGANGAGKSTLCKIISGLTMPSDGSMQLAGNEFSPRSKQDAESNGVEMVQQELNLIGNLSVAENLFLTCMSHRAGVIRKGDLHQNARKVLDRFGLADVDSHSKVDTLGIGQQQMVEIATALARKCKLLILDEPTAALSGRESQQLFEHLRTLRDQGVGIIYISHRLDEVASLTDRISVLRDGKHIATEETDSISTDQMVDLMSGENESNKAISHVSQCRDAVALRVRNLTCGIVQNVSFEVKQGQRFGIAGLVGSGRTELLRAIFGADIANSGEVFIGDSGQGRRFRSPSEAVESGLAMVTEDRKDNGLLLSQSIATNTTLSSLWLRFSRFGLLNRARETQSSRRQIEDMDTRCESIDQKVSTLSGGNQQKVAIAKWLVRDADVFLFDEPTRGIDVAARRKIYRLLESLAADGKGCVIVSSDLEELMETCDVVAVMCDGKLVETFERDQWSYEKIMQASFAGYVK
jgi:ribose transport system ATP-binding protein